MAAGTSPAGAIRQMLAQLVIASRKGCFRLISAFEDESLGRYLGSLVGTGRMFVGDRDHGEVTFSIGVSLDDNRKHTRGVLSGNAAAIAAAHEFGRARLSLAGGEIIEIDIRETNQRRGLFTVNGEIPGF